METPVLFLIYNRADTTQKVFDAIQKAKPKYLYVAADGPKNNSSDEAKCRYTRSIIAEVDWDCEVKTLFRDQNMGCRPAVSSAIKWFFDNEEEGIILEDDCLPHSDFFSFCEAMLATYRNNPKVMHITGGNFQFGQKRGDASYYFSRIAHIWGWATWRRAWSNYDVDMNDYPQFLKLPDRSSYFADKSSEKYWLFYFSKVYKKAGTWDYQWTYAVMKNKGLCIIPNVNLISNIGFGNQATHAEKKTDPVANMAVESIGQIRNPMVISVDEEADLFTIQKAFPTPGLHVRIINKIKGTIKKLKS
jgi:hypothetical protein